MNTTLLEQLRKQQETCWRNPKQKTFEDAMQTCPLNFSDVQDAADRWDRFSPYFREVFPETRPMNGIVESPLQKIPAMKTLLERDNRITVPGQLFLKMDSHLPVSGSIKARGGVYEVLKTAEDIALSHGFITTQDNYSIFASEHFKKLFSQYSISVGSTGNLGLSIDIISAKLGFRVAVHMSADARQWKKSSSLQGRGCN